MHLSLLCLSKMLFVEKLVVLVCLPALCSCAGNITLLSVWVNGYSAVLAFTFTSDVATWKILILLNRPVHTLEVVSAFRVSSFLKVW